MAAADRLPESLAQRPLSDIALEHSRSGPPVREVVLSDHTRILSQEPDTAVMALDGDGADDLEEPMLIRHKHPSSYPRRTASSTRTR